MKKSFYAITLAAVLLAGLLLLAAFAGGVWYYMEYSTTSTSTSTTSSTSSTSTSSTSSTSTTTSSTTSTLPSFYVCEKEVTGNQSVVTRCQGKMTREWVNTTLRCDIVYALANPNQTPYADSRVKVDGDTCYYTSTSISMGVGSMLTCETPKVNYTTPARLIKPR